MIKKYFSIFIFLNFFLLQTVFSFGQTKQHLLDSISKASPFNHSYIKFSPFTLVELEPSFNIGFEYQASPKIRLQHEIGYVSLFNPAYDLFVNNYTSGKQSNGIKLRSTIKFPLIIDNVNTRLKHKYLGIDFMFKYMEIKDYDVNVSRYDGAYWQYIDVNTNKYVGAVHFLYGYNNYISKSNNIIADWYVGVGLRYKYISDDTPDDVYYFNDLPWYDDYDGFMISIMAGMKLGFGI